MSQTETLMVLGLGVALALIGVLFFARFVWNIGQRISKIRAERNRPTQIRDLQADRDQLRASHAVMSQKLQSGLAEAKARVVEQEAEVSRHRNRVQTLVETVNGHRTDIEQRDQAISDLTDRAEQQAADLDANASAIEALKTEIETRDDDIHMLKAELAKTMDLLDESATQLHRLDAERAASMRAEMRTELQGAVRIPSLPEDLHAPREPLLIVKPSGSTQPRRFDFDAPQQAGEFDTPPPPRPTQRVASELSSLLSNARRNMMENQAEKAARPESEKARRPFANVVSIAQKMRSPDRE